MPFDEHEIRRILDAYLEGRATDKERALLDAFFQDHKNDAFRETLSDREYLLLENRISEGIKHRIKPAKKQSYSLALGIAASVTFLLIASFVYFFSAKDVPTEQPVISTIHRSTQKGQKLTVRLPDGSVVKLNSNSSISFPQTFSGTARNVALTGEAYFDVVHNPELPFVVDASRGKTTVLGTSFNIYEGPAGTEITLVSGKVNVTANNNTEALLSPGEQAVIVPNLTQIDIHAVDVSRYVEWKDNVLSFHETSLSDAAVELENWYGVEIQIDNPDIKTCRITARYENESLENVLESFRFMLNGSYTLKDKKVTISGKGCR